MMYMRTMFGNTAEVGPLDNRRYPNFHWTTARELLEARFFPLSRRPNRASGFTNGLKSRMRSVLTKAK
jgi:hypothetical protein